QFSNENSTLLNKKEELERTLKTLELVIMQHDNLSNLGKLATGIANELQKPLTRIRGFIQLLKPSLIEVGKDHYANEALLEINQANNLLYQYISAAKPSHPKLELLNLHTLIQGVIASMKEDS